MTPSSASPPEIFDRALLRRRLARAVAGGAEDFLLPRAADDLLDRLSAVKRTFGTVLDLGTPRPDAAARLAASLPGAEVVRLAPGEAALGRGRWTGLVGDEERLPFAAERFDLVVSLLSLQAANDLPGALVQARRVLVPDGLFLCCLFGGQTLTELRRALADAEADLTGGASPRVAPFADLRDLGGLLQRAGFALPVTDTESLTVRYAHPFALFADLRAMGATNALKLRSRRPLTRALIARAAAIYADRYADPDGRIRATFELVWLSGWAPHPSQQRPSKPGSARRPLAAALRGDG